MKNTLEDLVREYGNTPVASSDRCRKDVMDDIMALVQSAPARGPLTFDDVQFGYSANGGRSCTEPGPRRPAGFATNGEWYTWAGSLCKFVEQEAGHGALPDVPYGGLEQRFFQGLNTITRRAVLQVLGGHTDALMEQVRTHSDERRLFKHLFKVAAPVQAQESNAGRDTALEEAAKICEGELFYPGDDAGVDCQVNLAIEKIRALIGKPAPEGASVPDAAPVQAQEPVGFGLQHKETGRFGSRLYTTEQSAMIAKHEDANYNGPIELYTRTQPAFVAPVQPVAVAVPDGWKLVKKSEDDVSFERCNKLCGNGPCKDLCVAAPAAQGAAAPVNSILADYVVAEVNRGRFGERITPQLEAVIKQALQKAKPLYHSLLAQPAVVPEVRLANFGAGGPAAWSAAEALAPAPAPAPAPAKPAFTKGDTFPSGDCGHYESGIHNVAGNHYQAIVCYGDTAEKADTMRDQVLDALLAPSTGYAKFGYILQAADGHQTWLKGDPAAGMGRYGTVIQTYRKEGE